MSARRVVAGLVALGAALAGCGGSGSSGSSGSAGSPSSSASSSASATPGPTYTAPPASLPAAHVQLTTSPPPWPGPVVADSTNTAAYVTAAGLPYAEEMLQVHYHAHLDVNVNGQAVTVPLGVGFVTSGNKVVGLAPLHTHDTSGIIHIENSVPATFVLDQFFIEWGVRFTPTCLGAYCSGHGKELAVFVNGKRYTGDPTRLVLAKHQEIAVEYGDKGKLPTPPSSYTFANGL